MENHPLREVGRERSRREKAEKRERDPGGKVREGEGEEKRRKRERTTHKLAIGKLHGQRESTVFPSGKSSKLCGVAREGALDTEQSIPFVLPLCDFPLCTGCLRGWGPTQATGHAHAGVLSLQCNWGEP